MPAWQRDTPWRQGHVLPDDAVESLEILSTDSLSKFAAIVVSHDCDLAQSPEVEPAVEVIVGHWVTAVEGNFSFGKNARRLHLSLSGGTEVRAANLIASRKVRVEKTQLAGYVPVETVRPSALELTILQRWLAARYRRSAFPDEFDKRLEETGLRDRLGRILKVFGTLISAVYFDLDQGDEVIRSGSSDPYILGIYLLFSTETDPEAAEAAAEEARAAINEAFRRKCFSGTTGAWTHIELIECEAISDQAMTVQQAERFKRWSADHISLRADPPHSMLIDE